MQHIIQVIKGEKMNTMSGIIVLFEKKKKIVIVTLLFHYADLFSPFPWEMENQ